MRASGVMVADFVSCTSFMSDMPNLCLPFSCTEKSDVISPYCEDLVGTVISGLFRRSL